jgi:hypothetical protein
MLFCPAMYTMTMQAAHQSMIAALEGQFLSLIGKKLKTVKNAACTVTLSRLWCFQETLARICIGRFESTSNFSRNSINR